MIEVDGFKLHDKLIDRISIEKFVISHKLLFNGYFETPLKVIYQDYWEYAKAYNLVGQSLSKNLESYFNLRVFRECQGYCYNIKDININDVNEAVAIAFNDYKSQNKYSSLKGFKENDRNYRVLLSTIKYLKEEAKFKQIDDDDGLRIYIVKSNSKRPRRLDGPNYALYSSKLNIIEISEYANFIYNELINFDPDKNTNQETIKHQFKNAPNEYCIIAQLLATNQIEVIKNQFRFNGKTYFETTKLNKAINDKFEFDKNYDFNPYLNNFRNKTGDKYLLSLETLDKPDKTNIKRLKKIKDYFDNNDDVEVVNKGFKKVFKYLDDNKRD